MPSFIAPSDTTGFIAEFTDMNGRRHVLTKRETSRPWLDISYDDGARVLTIGAKKIEDAPGRAMISRPSRAGTVHPSASCLPASFQELRAFPSTERGADQEASELAP